MKLGMLMQSIKLRISGDHYEYCKDHGFKIILLGQGSLVTLLSN